MTPLARMFRRWSILLAPLFGDRSSATLAQFEQAAIFVALTALCGVMGIAHGGAVARLLFVAASLYGAYVYRRRSPWLLITWTLWLWAGTALVRRLIEYPHSFNAHDMVLGLPNAAVLFMLPDILMARGVARRPSVVASLGITIPIVYGLLNSLFRGDVAASVIAAADWVMPLVYYFYIATHGDRIEEFRPHLRAFVALSTAAIVPYSLYQFLFMTPWDQYWLDNSGLVATDQITDPTQNRVFGPFNNPGFLAIWMGWVLVLMGFYAGPLTILLAPLGVFLLIVTLSRSVYLSTMLGFVMLLLIAPPRNILRQGMIAAFAAVVVVGLVSILNPDVADNIESRISSMGNLQHDTSANVRAGIWAETPALIAETPLGQGIAAIGRSAALIPGGGESVVDSGVLGPFLAFGWLAGALYVFSMLGMTAMALFRARQSRSREAAAAACSALVPVGLLPFLTIAGFAAALLWISLVTATELNATASRRRAAAQRPALVARTSHA